MSLNKWVGIGRLTKEIEIKTTPNGRLVTNFSVAINRAYKKEGQQEADFINVVAWEKKAEFLSKYFRKGDPIQIVGRIETRSYQDKDGNKRIATEIVAEELSFVEGNGKRSDDSEVRNGPVSPDIEPDPIEEDDDDLPF